MIYTQTETRTNHPLEWLRLIQDAHKAGKELLPADDPKKRTLGFTAFHDGTDDHEYFTIRITNINEYKKDLTAIHPMITELLLTPQGRAKLPAFIGPFPMIDTSHLENTATATINQFPETDKRQLLVDDFVEWLHIIKDAKKLGKNVYVADEINLRRAGVLVLSKTGDGYTVSIKFSFMNTTKNLQKEFDILQDLEGLAQTAGGRESLLRSL